MARTLALCVLSTLCAMTAFAQRQDPLPAFAFQIKLDGTAVNFAKCGQIGSKTEVIEFQQGSGGVVQHIPGKTTFLPLECTASMTTDTTLYDWRHSVEVGNLQRKSIDIQLLDSALNLVTTFHLTQTWPSSLFIEKLDATSNEFIKQDISIVVDGMTRN